VQLDRTPLLGVPSTGVTSVGLVAKTILPEPVVELPSAVRDPLVGKVIAVGPVKVKVAACAPEVANVDPSASVSVAPVAGVVIVILLTVPDRTRLPLLSTVKDPVEDPEIVKFKSLEDEFDPESVTASLIPFQVVAASFQLSLRL
jgi:hypothetical protein